MTDFIRTQSGLILPEPKQEFPTPWELRYYPELEASIRYRLQNDCWCDFEAYQWLGEQADGTILYKSRDGNCSPSDGIDDAEICFDGEVKWDGCADFAFNEDVAQHVCGISAVRNLMLLIEAAYCDGAAILDKHGHFDGQPPQRTRIST